MSQKTSHNVWCLQSFTWSELGSCVLVSSGSFPSLSAEHRHLAVIYCGEPHQSRYSFQSLALSTSKVMLSAVSVPQCYSHCFESTLCDVLPLCCYHSHVRNDNIPELFWLMGFLECLPGGSDVIKHWKHKKRHQTVHIFDLITGFSPFSCSKIVFSWVLALCNVLFSTWWGMSPIIRCLCWKCSGVSYQQLESSGSSDAPLTDSGLSVW